MAVDAQLPSSEHHVPWRPLDAARAHVVRGDIRGDRILGHLLEIPGNLPNHLDRDRAVNDTKDAIERRLVQRNAPRLLKVDRRVRWRRARIDEDEPTSEPSLFPRGDRDALREGRTELQAHQVKGAHLPSAHQ